MKLPERPEDTFGREIFHAVLCDPRSTAACVKLVRKLTMMRALSCLVLRQTPRGALTKAGSLSRCVAVARSYFELSPNRSNHYNYTRSLLEKEFQSVSSRGQLD